jgi:DNA-binding XRE family transcriptional regulator
VLRQIREKLGFTQGEVAKVWGRSKQRVSQVEREVPIMQDTYDEVRLALDVLGRERREEINKEIKEIDAVVGKGEPAMFKLEEGSDG